MSAIQRFTPKLGKLVKWFDDGRFPYMERIEEWLDSVGVETKHDMHFIEEEVWKKKLVLETALDPPYKEMLY